LGVFFSIFFFFKFIYSVQLRSTYQLPLVCEKGQWSICANQFCDTSGSDEFTNTNAFENTVNRVYRSPSISAQFADRHDCTSLINVHRPEWQGNVLPYPSFSGRGREKETQKEAPIPKQEEIDRLWEMNCC
jgi:hypothetical protein